MEEMNYYKTTDSALAAWLVFRHVTILGSAELPNDTRKRLIFLRPDNIEELIEEWSASEDEEVLVAKRFFRSMNTVKHKLKDSRMIDG